MQIAQQGKGELYRAYHDELYAERMPGYVRMGAAVAFALQTAFVPLDRWAYPDQFAALFMVRMALNVVIGAIYFWGSRICPRASQIALCFAMGLSMLVLIYATDAPISKYYAGLILVFVGMPVLLPLTAVEASVICTVLIGIFAISPRFASGSVDWGTYGLHLFFLMAAGVESAASCAFMERTRFKDFVQRRELQQARDELKQLDRAKSRFTANVHHELRTPLTLILAPLEAMLGGEFGEVKEEQHRYLRTVHVNALRLLKLINNLLDLAKVEGKQLRLVRRPCDAGRIADDLVAGAQPLAEQKRIALTTRGLEALPRINADPDALEKVVVNLLGNALKFTEPGGRIELRGEAAGDGVGLTVSDTGVGMPPDQLERVFDRFAQVDASATRKHEGTGIGLSLAKELVELHGGRIWAESQGVGRGSTFHVFLPAGEPDEAPEEEVLATAGGRSVQLDRSLGAVQAELDAALPDDPFVEMERSVARWHAGSEAPAADADGLSTPPGAPEVLVAEDNADMRQLLAFLLSREFRVRLARNGREALEAVRERAPALVLTDVMMPEMSGTELCRELKGDPRTAGIPVIIVTSKAERESKIEGLELGADDWVAKPFHPRELLARVRSLVRVHELQNELLERNRALEQMNAELSRAMAELKEAEVQVLESERLAAVGELAAGVAHEVNNPVNFALNAVHTLRGHVEQLSVLARRFAELDPRDEAKLAQRVGEVRREIEELGLEELGAELAELVDIVSEGLERTGRLVGDLRDFAGTSRTGRHPVDVRAGLESTLRLLRHSLQSAEVRLEASLGDRPLWVHGDPGALNQVFLNLLKNSAEALEGRGGTIRIEARREGEWISVGVGDDGPGIAPEARNRLFEPFFSTKGAGRGAGLGLSICRRIATEHGGTVVMSSPPGEGVCFTVRLPAVRGDSSDAT